MPAQINTHTENTKVQKHTEDTHPLTYNNRPTYKDILYVLHHPIPTKLTQTHMLREYGDADTQGFHRPRAVITQSELTKLTQLTYPGSLLSLSPRHQAHSQRPAGFLHLRPLSHCPFPNSIDFHHASPDPHTPCLSAPLPNNPPARLYLAEFSSCFSRLNIINSQTVTSPPATD